MLYPVELRARVESLQTTTNNFARYYQLHTNVVRKYKLAVPIRSFKYGRGGGIRTHDPLLPKQMRYQAALRPEEGRIIETVGGEVNCCSIVFFYQARLLAPPNYFCY